MIICCCGWFLRERVASVNICPRAQEWPTALGIFEIHHLWKHGAHSCTSFCSCRTTRPLTFLRIRSCMDVGLSSQIFYPPLTGWFIWSHWSFDLCWRKVSTASCYVQERHLCRQKKKKKCVCMCVCEMGWGWTTTDPPLTVAQWWSIHVGSIAAFETDGWCAISHGRNTQRIALTYRCATVIQW